MERRRRIAYNEQVKVNCVSIHFVIVVIILKIING